HVIGSLLETGRRPRWCRRGRPSRTGDAASPSICRRAPPRKMLPRGPDTLRLTVPQQPPSDRLSGLTPTVEDIKRAAARIAGQVEVTPFLHSRTLSQIA